MAGLSESAKRELAENQARSQASRDAGAPQDGSQPTPTQEENDLAAVGVFVPVKDHDGSPIDPQSPNPEPPDQGPAPVLTTISPTQYNLPDVNLVLTGQNFTDGCRVVFDGQSSGGTVTSPTQINVAINYGGSAGTYDVLVRDGYGRDSNAMQFEFVDVASQRTTSRKTQAQSDRV